MITIPRATALAAVVCLFSTAANAAVGVGDKPSFDVQSTSGSRLSLEQYRGKIIIVDFWATWCGPCMAEAEHMVRLHKEFGPKGVQIIGISLDEDEAALKQVIKAKGFDWPQFFDGNGWGNQIGKQWGVQSIPATYIIDPEGTVVWKGHPAQIDAPLATALQKTPPSAIDPAVMKEADAKLDEIEMLIKDAPDRALNLLGTVPAESRKVDELDKRIGKIEKALDATAKSAVTEADALVSQGKFEEAANKLNLVVSAMAKTETGKLAAGKLKTMESNPEYLKQKKAAEDAKAEVERKAQADQALERAKALATEKRHEEAYQAYKSIVRRFEGLPAAKVAADAVATYDKDAAFIRKMNDNAAKDRAESMLSLARNYARTNLDTARRKYNEVINSFPNTSFADTAKRELAELEAKAKKK